jgi:DNA polymerase-3 subunit epsilon
MAATHGREIVFDTETTGLSPDQGHRVVDIACVELVDLMPTGREFQVFINPERGMPDEAFQVHGLSAEFLRDKPKFAEIADGFLDFIGDSTLVAHNANFDLKFINFELKKAKRPPLTNSYVDTVAVAKKQISGKVSLDDLCRKFGIDLSSRDKHGALVDTRLLARVYLELMGGRERKLNLDAAASAVADAPSTRPWRAPRPDVGLASADEAAAHAAFLSNVKKPIWAKVFEARAAREAAEEAPAPRM